MRPLPGLPARDEEGFTLPELLVVAVVLPIIMGAIAAGIIAIADNSTNTSNRLADSENAQLSAAYFTRDVEGAQYVTTQVAATSPAVCGSGNTFVLGMYRSAGNGFYVSYWVKSSGSNLELVRESCSSTGTLLSTTLESDDITATSAAVSISPTSFSTGAALGWTPTIAYTTATSTVTLPAATIPVTSTNGFSTGSVSVLTSSGYQTLTCTGTTPTTFTGCTGGSSTYVLPTGYAVTQAASVSGIELSVAQPNSGNTYRLAAVPRAWSSTASGLTSGENPVDAPALLTLGSGVTVQGGNNSVLTVDGVIDVNGGTLSCTGGPTVTAYGYEATNGTSAIGCGTGGPTTTSPALPDPLANYLPAYGSTAFPHETVYSTSPSGVCQPGEYTVNLTCSSLEPGVYVLDAGLNLSGNSSISLASDAGDNGVLLYLPCDPPGAPSTCNESISLGGKTSFNLGPLTNTQSAALLGTSGLGGLVVWQDKGDTSGASFGGTPSGAVTCSTNPEVPACGTVYAPSAAITFQGNALGIFGRVIAASVSLSGSTPLTVTGQ